MNATKILTLSNEKYKYDVILKCLTFLVVNTTNAVVCCVYYADK